MKIPETLKTLTKRLCNEGYKPEEARALVLLQTTGMPVCKEGDTAWHHDSKIGLQIVALAPSHDLDFNDFQRAWVIPDLDACETDYPVVDMVRIPKDTYFPSPATRARFSSPPIPAPLFKADGSVVWPEGWTLEQKIHEIDFTLRHCTPGLPAREIHESSFVKSMVRDLLENYGWKVHGLLAQARIDGDREIV